MSKILRFPCPLCCTWVCDKCGWKRHGATFDYDHHRCHKCGSTKGTKVPTVHPVGSYKRLDHVDVFITEFRKELDSNAKTTIP